ncbi:hypothetical protein NQ318_005796 [Aromia moschata]|uniref:Serine palmitoyltransferase 1 n=1 Tax=Aromia moschata TaxID=1265417 RepID=A0AAV8YT92_9CUCU|nr:hypothetical protein NQ318_005796 [Aromia moschata]
MDQELLQERLSQFNPEPLIDFDETITKENIEKYTIVEDDDNIDLAKTNFLNVLNNEEIMRASENIIRKYGRTTDVHLELEQRIAEFLNMEEAIVYSYGFVAISSSIAAYCKRKDVVFVDKEANFPIQQGLIAAKSTVVRFDHNDPQSLREEVQKIVDGEKHKKPSRKFLVVEGVSWKTGKLLPLEEFLKVAEDFKIRVFLEETYSVGIFGDHGRGLTEHFNIDPTRLDMIMGTLESAIGSIGGYCAGSHMTIEHQRLSGSGTLRKKLRALAVEFHDFLRDKCKFNVISDPESAFKVFTVFEEDEERRKQKERKMHEYCRKSGVHFRVNENGLVINLNVALYDNRPRLEKVCNTLRKISEL